MVLRKSIIVRSQLIKKYSNLYNDTFNFRMKTYHCLNNDIANSIIETNTQTTNYTGNKYLNNNSTNCYIESNTILY